MPKGHPRCPDCGGAGGKMARRAGSPPRWVRCKCVPNHIGDHSRIQALAHVKHECEKDSSTTLAMAVEIAIYCGITEEELTTYLMDNMTAHAWIEAYRAHEVIKDIYSKETAK